MSESRDAADAGEELSPTARERLAELVELQPTKNAELEERWDLESGSEVHAYLESELSAYYYRDDDSMIRATADAVAIAGGDPRDATVTVSAFEADLIDVLPGPDERSRSVVATLHALRETREDVDADAETVRRALRALSRRGVVSIVYRTVPTFRLARARDELSIAVREDAEDLEDAEDAPGADPTGDDAVAAIEETQAEYESELEAGAGDAR